MALQVMGHRFESGILQAPSGKGVYMNDKTKKYLRIGGAVAIVAGSVAGYIGGATESTMTAVVGLTIACVVGIIAVIKAV